MLSSLRFNSLKSDGAQYLASALYVNNTLRFLCLSGNDLCGLDGMNDQGYDLTGISALCRSLHVNTRLKTLKIAENDIGNDGAKYIADALRENKCLSVLDLHGNCLFSVLEEEMSLIESEETKTPDFASSSISSDPNMSHQNSEDMTEIPKIEKHGQSVDVSDTGQVALKYELTGSEGGGSLLTAIGESKYLTSIDLSWNEMGPKSAILFASSLINNSTLTYLDLHGNFIGDSGVSALCIFLKGDSCKLNVLYIQRIGMTTCGSLLIAEVLGTNKT